MWEILHHPVLCNVHQTTLSSPSKTITDQIFAEVEVDRGQQTQTPPTSLHKHETLLSKPVYSFSITVFPSCRLVTFLLELISICLSNHYFSSLKWYWGSIIMYLHTDILFDGAINMCCDQGAFSLTSHTCLLLAEACFWSVISVSSSKLIISRLLSSLTAPPLLSISPTALWPPDRPAPLVLRGLAARRARCVRVKGEVRGCHWKHAIFYIFAPCHQIRMRCSGRCMFGKHPFRGCLSFDLNQNQISSAKVILAHPMHYQKSVETLHPMWGISGFGSFLLTLSL